jgi:hypothetical protein
LGSEVRTTLNADAWKHNQALVDIPGMSNFGNYALSLMPAGQLDGPAFRRFSNKTEIISTIDRPC